MNRSFASPGTDLLPFKIVGSPTLRLLLLAQLAMAAQPHRSSGMASVDPDGVRSLLSNPAGIGLLDGHEISLQLGGDQQPMGQSAILAGIPHLGIGWESHSFGGDFSASNLLIGTGATVKNLSVGLLAVRHLGDSESGSAALADAAAPDSKSRVWSADLGLLWRPFSRFSVGWTSQDFFDRDPSRDRTNAVGLGIRPLASASLAFSAQALLAATPWSRGAWDQVNWELGAKIRPLSWLELEAHADPEHPRRYGFGLRMQVSPQASLFSEAAGTASGPEFQTAGMRFSMRSRPALPTSDGVLVYRVANPDSESPSDKFWRARPGFASVREDFHEMAKLADLKTVVLDLGSNRFSPTRAGTLGRLVLDLRRQGKQVYGWSNDLDMSSLHILSACDKAAISPDGTVRARGLAIDVLYFGKLLKRHGVTVQVIKTGPWKAAMEPYEKDSMSTQARENLSRILVDLDSMIVFGAATSRKLDPAALRSYIDTGSLLPATARSQWLVDTLLDHDDLSRWAKGRNLASALAGVHDETWGNPRRVAVMVLEGQIVDQPGETGMVPWNKSLAARTVAARLEAMRKDPSIGAVVLRIQSPGGSVAGSERLRRAVERLAKDKPVAASFGHTAASGAYMLALGADVIFSEPEAMVGSIGVFAAKPSVAGLLDSLGIKAERVRTAPHAGASSMYSPLDSLELARMTEYVEDAHRNFDDEVMKSRHLDSTGLSRVNGGRVFSGVTARRLGLVDSLGGLDEAVAWARTKAGLSTQAAPLWFDGKTSSSISEQVFSLAGAAPSSKFWLFQTWQAFADAPRATVWSQSAWEPEWK